VIESRELYPRDYVTEVGLVTISAGRLEAEVLLLLHVAMRDLDERVIELITEGIPTSAACDKLVRIADLPPLNESDELRQRLVAAARRAQTLSRERNHVVHSFLVPDSDGWLTADPRRQRPSSVVEMSTLGALVRGLDEAARELHALSAEVLDLLADPAEVTVESNGTSWTPVFKRRGSPS
jgi:biotin carboxylase